MFNRVPPELSLKIMAHLTLQDLRSIRLACRAWSVFVHEQSDAVYRMAAYQHRFIESPKVTLEAAKRHVNDNGPAKDWVTFCAGRYETEQSWLGQGPSSALEIHSSAVEDMTTSFRIDEQHGFAIVTYYHGGLLVLNVRNHGIGQPLWGLSKNHVKELPSCEYDKGFLVLSYPSEFVEVWRHVVGMEEFNNTKRVSQPSSEMMEAAQEADALYPARSKQGRGRFIPWAFIKPHEYPSRYRLLYPTLLAASDERVLLFDVTSGELLGHIDHRSGSGTQIEILRAVDVHGQYALVAYTHELRVFDLGHGTLQCSIPVYETSRNPVLRLQDEERDILQMVRDVAALRHHGITENFNPPTHEQWFPEPNISTARISPCGRHIMILQENDRLVLVENFERLIEGTALIDDIVTDIILRTNRVYMQLPHMDVSENRVVVTSSSGIYLVTLDATLYKTQPTPPSLDVLNGRSFPRLAVTWAPRFVERSRWSPPIPGLPPHYAVFPPSPEGSDTEYFSDNVVEADNKRRLCCIDVGPSQGLDDSLLSQVRRSLRGLA